MQSDVKKPPPKTPLVLALIVLVIIVAVVFAIGVVPRIAQQKELKDEHQETVDAIPVVHTIIAKPAVKREAITLPGNIGAMQYATIYARVDGYLKSRLVDIGDQVKTGQLLAEIDAPTVDQHVNQAKADLLAAKANLVTSQANLKENIAKEASAKADIAKTKADYDYAAITAKRWTNLCVRGAVSEQSRDEKVRMLGAQTAEVDVRNSNYDAAVSQVAASRSAVEAAKATVQAKAADLARVSADQSFKYVKAPFDGVITERKVDPGDLITQGSQTSSLELYQMAKLDVLRIYVGVPQRVARYLKPGQTADVFVAEFPEQKFQGVVTNVSGALDPNTRTRQTEVHVKNPEHFLLPGMYGQVQLADVRDYPWIRVPGTTLVPKPDGMYVVVVTDGKARYKKITIGRDFGNDVEVKEGLSGEDVVVVSPTDDLVDGETVRAQPLPVES